MWCKSDLATKDNWVFVRTVLAELTRLGFPLSKCSWLLTQGNQKDTSELRILLEKLLLLTNLCELRENLVFGFRELRQLCQFWRLSIEVMSRRLARKNVERDGCTDDREGILHVGYAGGGEGGLTEKTRARGDVCANYGH